MEPQHKQKQFVEEHEQPFFLVDTGGWTIKHGIVCLTEDTRRKSPSPSQRPSQTPNATARLPHQMNTWVGTDILSSIKNQSQLFISRPIDRGYITDFKTQILVWESILNQKYPYSCHDLTPSCTHVEEESSYSIALDYHHSLSHLEYCTLAHQGVTIAKSTSNTSSTTARTNTTSNTMISAHKKQKPDTQHAQFNTTYQTYLTTLVLLSKPFHPRCLMEYEDEIWFRTFGFGRIIRRLSASCSAYRYLYHDCDQWKEKKEIKDEEENDVRGKEVYHDHSKKGTENGTQNTTNRLIGRVQDDKTGCCCVIESGFSLTHIVPTVDTLAIECAIRRINVGGKLLTNLLKEVISYRHWNMMDEFAVVNEVKESLCFIAPTKQAFEQELQDAKYIRMGYRWFDRDFILPDFVNTFHGVVRVPPTLQNFQHRQQLQLTQKQIQYKDSTTDNDAKLNEEKRAENKILSEDNLSTKNVSKDDGFEIDECKDPDIQDEDEIDSEEETEDAIRSRILKQREEDQRRQQKEKEEHQVLPMSVERFTVPEVLFRPTDIGLNQLGLAEAIVQSIHACDPMYHAAMYHNIVLTGGNVNLPNFKERLESEIRALAPSNFTVRVYVPEDPVTYAWAGARDWVMSKSIFDRGYIERVQWEELKKAGHDWSTIWIDSRREKIPHGFVIL